MLIKSQLPGSLHHSQEDADEQQTLALAAQQSFDTYRKPTRRDEFLTTMEVIAPWAALCEAIELSRHKVGNGRLPIGVERGSPYANMNRFGIARTVTHIRFLITKMVWSISHRTSRVGALSIGLL